MITTFLKRAGLLFTLVTCTVLSANAIIYPINITLTGLQEVPPNASTGTGTLVGTYNDSSNVLKYTVTFSGLSANVTAAHFHAPAFPGINAGITYGPAGFPTGVMSGNFVDSVVLRPGQEDTLMRGLWYFNIHTSTYPGGELRGQVFLQKTSFVVPVIECPSDTAVDNDPGLCSASVALTAVDTTADPSSTIFYRIGTTVITSPHVFPVGTTTVVATSINVAGVDSCSFTVTVNDTEAPVVTCPANITVPNDPGQCGAIVNFVATATDNCSGVVVTYDRNPGSFFEVGTTTVQAFATDASGNRDTCSFDITVNDVEPPVIDSLRTNPRVLWPPNHKMRNVRVDYTATDNCPGPIDCAITVTSNEPQAGPGGNNSNDWVIIDEHNIRLRAERTGRGPHRIYTITVGCTDQHGNSASADTVVLVPHDLRSAIIRMILGIGHFSGNSPILLNEEDPDRSSIVTVYPVPSNNHFNINIEPSNNEEKISVRIIDMSGRLLEYKYNLQGRQTVQMGHRLISGQYIIEIRQGSQSKLIKVVKQ